MNYKIFRFKRAMWFGWEHLIKGGAEMAVHKLFPRTSAWLDKLINEGEDDHEYYCDAIYEVHETELDEFVAALNKEADLDKPYTLEQLLEEEFIVRMRSK